MIFHAQNLNVCIDAKPEQWQVPSQDLILEAATPYTAQKPRNRNTPQQVNGICRLLKTMYWGYTFTLTKKKPTYMTTQVFLLMWFLLCDMFAVFSFWKYVFPLLFYVHGFPRMQLDVLPQWIVLNCHVFSKWNYSMLFRCEFAVFFSKRVSMFFVILYIVASCSYVLFLFCCAIDPRHQKR